MAISENPTTRESLRRAVLGDLVDRCAAAAVPIEGGALDGIEVVSLGTLRGLITTALEDDLPPPSERRAEVTTPAIVLVSAICPECRLPVEIIVGLSPQLTVDNDGAEIAVKAKSKSRVHVCGQLALADIVGDQESFELEDIIGDDHLDDEDGEANPEGAALPPDAPEDDGSAADVPADRCPFPDCGRDAEHTGDHFNEAVSVEAAERIETIYSQAAERVARKRAGRVKAHVDTGGATQ